MSIWEKRMTLSLKDFVLFSVFSSNICSSYFAYKANERFDILQKSVTKQIGSLSSSLKEQAATKIIERKLEPILVAKDILNTPNYWNETSTNVLLVIGGVVTVGILLYLGYGWFSNTGLGKTFKAVDDAIGYTTKATKDFFDPKNGNGNSNSSKQGNIDSTPICGPESQSSISDSMVTFTPNAGSIISTSNQTGNTQQTNLEFAEEYVLEQNFSNIGTHVITESTLTGTTLTTTVESVVPVFQHYEQDLVPEDLLIQTANSENLASVMDAINDCN